MLPTSITGVFLLRESSDGELELEGELEGLSSDYEYGVRLHHDKQTQFETGFCPMTNSYLEDPHVILQANGLGQASLNHLIEASSVLPTGSKESMIGKRISIQQLGKGFLLTDGDVIACCTIESAGSANESHSDSEESSANGDDFEGDDGERMDFGSDSSDDD